MHATYLPTYTSISPFLDEEIDNPFGVTVRIKWENFYVKTLRKNFQKLNTFFIVIVIFS